MLTHALASVATTLTFSFDKAVANSNLPQAFGELIRLEPDEQTVARTRSGRAQIARWTDEVFLQLGVAGRVFVHIEMHDFLSLRHENMTHRARQFHRFRRADAVLPGV